jgi:beta-lactam-binding protein with PASTA domain
VIDQDPDAGAIVDEGSQVTLTIALGDETVTVPDIRNRPESEALNLIRDAGLTIGVRSEAFDPAVPANSIVSQSLAPGSVVAPNTPVDYTVSIGASPSPSPSPTPTPTPTPSPTPEPTPTPRANVGDYRCITLAQASVEITADGFRVGEVTGVPEGYEPAPESVVIDQTPNPGMRRELGARIDLKVTDPASLPSCPP